MPGRRIITPWGRARLSRAVVCLSFLALQLWGCAGDDSNQSRANFSDYYPMTNGVYRTYQVTRLNFGTGVETVKMTEALMVGATYNGLASIRTWVCPSNTWRADVASGGSILRVAGVLPGTVPQGQIGTMTLGIDNWEIGQSVSSSLSTFLRSNADPISVTSTVTFQGFEDVTVEAGTFKRSMKIDLWRMIETRGTLVRTEWYGHGIGLVKSIGGSDSIGIGVEDWELTAYGTLSAPPPQLLSIAPSVGLAGHATEVTLTGDAFSSEAQVTFGLWPAAAVTVGSSTVITALTPANIVGTVDVAVVNPDCQASLLEQAFTFEIP